MWDLPDGRTLYVESKNWAKISTNADRLERLEGMKTQFRKHVKEAIGTHIDEFADVTGANSVKWVNDEAPRLHYELRGNFFNDSHQTVKTSGADIREEFIDVIANDESPVFANLRELLEYGTDNFDTKMDEFLRIEVYDEITPPFSS